MSYDRNRARRRAEIERGGPGGETLAEFHEREKPHVQLGDRLPRVPCTRTPDLFTGLRKGKDHADLFDRPKDTP